MLLSASLRPHHLSRRFRRTLIGAANCRVAGQQTPNTNPADKLGAISLSVFLGSSKSQSSSDSQSNTARGSSLQAGGNFAAEEYMLKVWQILKPIAQQIVTSIDLVGGWGFLKKNTKRKTD